MSRVVVITSLLALVQACAQRPWMSEAQTGNLPNLRHYVEVASARHRFDEADVRKLAGAVAEREIATADDRGAYDRILQLGPCVSELYWSLHRQTLHRTETGAAANLLLLDWDLLDSTPSLRLLRDATDGAWRAVGIRATQSVSLRGEVHRALLDPDARVRRAAIMTMRADPLPDDGPWLLDVVRLDPESALRAVAVAVLGETGDAQSMLLLLDRWDAMDESLKLAFLQALDAAPMRRTIGVELLSRIMQNDDAMPGVVAASLLYNSHGVSSGLALGKLSTALRSGTMSEQLLVLATLGLREPSLRSEIVNRARDTMPFVRVAALELLINASRDAVNDRKRLSTIALSRDADAGEANRALALLGEKRAIAYIETRLAAAHAADRLAAARLLISIGQWNAVARALTDDHPAVRLATACQVLAAERS